MMPDNMPQKTWKKAHEFLDALANGTTDLQQLAAEEAHINAEIAKLQEIVRTHAEEAAKATYYYADKMDELKKECDALAGALGKTTRLLRRYREETPPGHSPSMICHEADAALITARAELAKYEGKE